MSFKYILYESNPLYGLEFKYLFIAIHQALMILKTNTSSSINIDIILNTTENIKFPIKVETFCIDSNYNLSIQNEKKYSLSNEKELDLFISKIRENNFNTYSFENDSCVINAIYNICLCESKSQNISEKKYLNKEINKELNKDLNEEKNYKEESTYLVKNIFDKIKKNTGPHINIVKEEKQEKNDIPEIEVEKLRMTIEKLEKTKEITTEAISDLTKELEEEEKNLTSYVENYNDEKKNAKKEDEELDKKISVFISEKEYTYKKIYNAMKKAKNGEINFNKIPSLFISKFPVFLFMEGKDCHGNDVRERLLDTDDEYRIFKMLHDSLVNENFIEPENEKDIDIICEFMDFLPNGYQAITPEEIMNFHNKKDTSGACIMFNTDETEQEECLNNEKNDTYDTYDNRAF
jgi:hypothetical protein